MCDDNEPMCSRKLFVGGLNYKSTEESLKSHFEQWGEVVYCDVVRDHLARKSRGFGFIAYKRAHMVDDAQAARPHEIDGRGVETKRYLPKEGLNNLEFRLTSNKLHVRGIEDDLDEEDLREYFGSYGNIVSVNVVTDRNTGKKRGFAFVEFDDYDPVDKIVLHRHCVVKGKKLEVKKSLSREQMYNIKIIKRMKHRGRGTGGPREWHPAHEFDRGYTDGRNNDCSGWNDSYIVNYSIRGGGNFGSARYGGTGTIPCNTGYAQVSLMPYGERGTGGYGSCGGWNDVYLDNYSSGGGGGGLGSNFESGGYGGTVTIPCNTGYAQVSLRPYGERGTGGYGSCGGWNDVYHENYSSSGGGGLGSNFESGGYGGTVAIPCNTGYAQVSLRPYGERGTGGYGSCSGWNGVYHENYSSGGGGGLGSNFESGGYGGTGTIPCNTGYAQVSLRPYGERGFVGYGSL